MQIGIGRKTKDWARVRRGLVPRFERVGITSCEIHFPQCWRNDCLSFAHTKKRRFVTDLTRVVLACAACHTAVEGMSHEEMERVLEKIISERTMQP